MSDFSGRLVSYGLALETVRGTAVQPQFWIRWETANVTDTATTILNQSALNVLDKYSGSEVISTWAAGQIAGKITDHAFGLILYATFGSYSVGTKAGETVVYNHTFTESQLNAPTSLTITRVDPNVSNQYTKGMVNSLEVAIKTGDFVRHTTNFMANPNATPGAQTVAYLPYENEFTAKHVTVQFNNGTAIPLTSFNLTISKDVDNYWIIGQTNPGDIFARDVEIKGEMVLRYTDQTYYTERFGNTPESVLVTIQNTDVIIGSTSNPTLTFTMPTCYLNEWKVDQSIDGMVQQTIDFEAVYNITQGFAIKSVLTNKHSTYMAGGIS